MKLKYGCLYSFIYVVLLVTFLFFTVKLTFDYLFERWIYRLLFTPLELFIVLHIYYAKIGKTLGRLWPKEPQEPE